MNAQLLERIDMIQEASIDAELEVLNSMTDTYLKELWVLQECDESADLSAFGVFQEADNSEEGLNKQANSILAQAKGKPNESLIKRILLFIPRLIKAIISKIASSDRIFKKRIKNLEKDIKNKMKNESSGSNEDTNELKGATVHQKALPMRSVEPDWHKGGASHNPPDMEIKLIFGWTHLEGYGHVHTADVWEELHLMYGMPRVPDLNQILIVLDNEVTYSSEYLRANKDEIFEKFNRDWSAYHDALKKKMENLSKNIYKMRENKITIKFDSWDEALNLLKDYTEYWGNVTDLKKWLKTVEKIYNKLAEYPERSLKPRDGEKALGFDFSTYEPYQTALKTTLSICNLSSLIVSQLEIAYTEDLDTIAKFVQGGYQ